jgi:transketolase
MPNLTNLNSSDLRRLILRQSFDSGVGHIGSSLSIADLLVAILGGIDRMRDTFVLSKGHAALAYYCALHLLGEIDRAQLATYCGDDTHFGVHPEPGVPGVAFATGSLGHGLSLATGVALANAVKNDASHTLALLSDAELNEGSTWEALQFAGHHELNLLTAIIDNNGQQALGQTRDIIDLSAFDKIADLLGWDVRVIDGHSVPDISEAVFGEPRLKPRMIVANTVSGKGVSFMEHKVAWHYLPLSQDQLTQALGEIG